MRQHRGLDHRRPIRQWTKRNAFHPVGPRQRVGSILGLRSYAFHRPNIGEFRGPHQMAEWCWSYRWWNHMKPDRRDYHRIVLLCTGLGARTKSSCLELVELVSVYCKEDHEKTQWISKQTYLESLHWHLLWEHVSFWCVFGWSHLSLPEGQDGNA